MPNAVLLTGATGFLGRELLKQLIEGLPVEQTIYCLIRGHIHSQAPGAPSSQQELAEERLRKLLGELGYHDLKGPVLARVRAVAGDIGHKSLGATPETLAELTTQVGHIYHGAATVRFDHPIDEARRINVEGTRHVLELAARIEAAGGKPRLSYIGTSFVAGTRRGRVYETELSVEQSFHNTYEQTKAEGEALVRKQMADSGLQATLFRPSIIVGDSRTGATSSFKVMYWPLKVFSRGLIPIVPASRAGVVDMVPVDYVIAAIWELSQRSDTIGGCYHLCAGPEGSTTIGAALDQAAAFFRVRKPLFVPTQTFERYVRPLFHLLLRGKRRQALDAGRVYVPYLNYQASFDTTNTRHELQNTGITPPSVHDYFAKLMRFCIDSNWGKRPLRPSASGRPGQ
jgi:long-chain acyl-CoA synthetase